MCPPVLTEEERRERLLLAEIAKEDEAAAYEEGFWLPRQAEGEEVVYLSWPLLEGETLETELELTQTSLTAPAAAGTQVGVLRGYVNGTQVGEVPLICAAAVPRDLAEPQNPLQRLLGWFWN